MHSRDEMKKGFSPFIISVILLMMTVSLAELSPLINNIHERDNIITIVENNITISDEIVIFANESLSLENKSELHAEIRN